MFATCESILINWGHPQLRLILAGVQHNRFCTCYHCLIEHVFYSYFRITLLFFAVSGLDLLNHLNDLSDETKKEIIEWIYLQQLQPSSESSPTLGKAKMKKLFWLISILCFQRVSLAFEDLRPMDPSLLRTFAILQ